tara:strand:+ start:435 stop:1214 length:780 start_codon:yes stop_codon:yes gene_type:complete
MSVENVRDIGEILASIEALKEQANHLNETDKHQDNAPEQDSLPASPVAEMAASKADVVLLDDVYRKGKSQQERKAETLHIAAHQKTKTRLSQGYKSTPSDSEFDRMLSILMKDMEHQSEKTGTSIEPKLSYTGQSDTHDPNELTNLKADIDGLLSPYLNSPATTSNLQSTSSPKFSYIQGTEKQEKPQQRSRQKDLIDDKLLSAVITDEMRAEIANYILAEIKQQISGWIAENLENIVEEALRSVSTEARDAVKARSVR